jgi:hypothetical protein
MRPLALESTPPTTQRWLAHFHRNACTLLPVPWEAGADLADSDKTAIISSIQAFQLGESSEGRHLMRYAREWAERSGDADYLHAIRALIAEETRHANTLGRFMDLNGIDRIERGWTDSVFRRLRNVVGTLEISIGVLITAEIIAKLCRPAAVRYLVRDSAGVTALALYIDICPHIAITWRGTHCA